MKRVLIANRGEIALRIIRACHEEGLEAVAVYSVADRRSLHVQAADYAVAIGPPPPGESYLRPDLLLAAAHQTGAHAIHPGYGFLSERAEFARAVEDAGLIFIGPPAAAIHAMGNKTEARRRMQAAGVPIVPGTTVPAVDAASLDVVAREIGFPVVIKASAGGGGRGMRVVQKSGELEGALAAASSEALKAFGDGAVYVEKYIERPRHVEIQILADHERTVHLGERECSVQRRHQKLVEESPSVAVSPELRERMGAAAVAAGSAVGYRSAGTCEFLLGSDASFYFLEMNTRIQVEHPVTEMVYGVDLVREQLRIARGLPMTVPHGRMEPKGWAIECRLTSEDPANGFLPSTGIISYLRPPSGNGVRWDGGVAAGDEITLFYDSLLGKLIVWGTDREQARRKMIRALDELILAGVSTNLAFHRRLMADPEFVNGEIDTQFLDRRSDLVAATMTASHGIIAAVAAVLAEDAARQRRQLPPPEAAAAPLAWTRAGRLEGLR
ncbi:MAG: acetyl-CoA carboxylase biotin carboxylase subunit [Gemmatimonadota bacterium]